VELVILHHNRISSKLRIYEGVKRWLDILICLLVMPVALPAMALCAVLTYLETGRPVFFVQERIGRGGRIFRIYKFRSMRVGCENSTSRAFMKAYIRGASSEKQVDGKTYKPIQAHQIPRIGRFLRKTSLDELPQLINVLKGEMSLVGPRPFVLWEVEEFQPWHFERQEVLPGITGLAQVLGRSSIEFNSLVRYDIEYIEHRSLLLDLKIMYWTFAQVIGGKGAS
jgi:lipopolysaccharide/colanic/teichoic acid biosynthesis glycosyltransferase